VSFSRPLISREVRVETNRENIFNMLNEEQRAFVEFVLRNYVQEGVDELDLSKLSTLLNAKYGSTHAAQQKLGDVTEIKAVFVGFQRRLYEEAS
jgi:type I restriction enzyme R subunit